MTLDVLQEDSPFILDLKSRVQAGLNLLIHALSLEDNLDKQGKLTKRVVSSPSTKKMVVKSYLEPML
jgi:hypothetical protein